MGLFAEGSEEAREFGVTAVVEIAFFVFGAVGFVGKLVEEFDGVFVRQAFLVEAIHDFVDAVTVIDAEIRFAANADNIANEEGEWAGIFSVDVGIELGWEEAEMLDFWTIEILAHFVARDVFVEPIIWRKILWLELVGATRNNIAEWCRNGAASNLVVDLDGVEEAEAVMLFVVEIGKAIGHI